MDKQSTVEFRNVGQLYFPQTRVECHYSLTSDHQWSSSDWIGIFEMGCSSVTQYYTYTWALVPEGYTEGTNVNCCVLFQAFYLPRPSAVEYQFVYVDKMGKVCARSRPFTFRAPKPLEELETLKEDQDEEDGEEELLLVIPRAQLLQSRLEECLKKQVDIQQALDVAKKEVVNEKERIIAGSELICFTVLLLSFSVSFAFPFSFSFSISSKIFRRDSWCFLWWSASASRFERFHPHSIHLKRPPFPKRLPPAAPL